MDKYYKRIFWGILITVFNFHIGPINILPSFIGYVIIILSLYNLYKETNNKTYKNLCIITSILILSSLSLETILFFNADNIEVILVSRYVIAINMLMEYILYYYLLRTLIIQYNIEKDESMVLSIYLIVFAVSTLGSLIILLLNLDYYRIIILLSVIVLKIYTAFKVRNFHHLSLDEN